MFKGMLTHTLALPICLLGLTPRAWAEADLPPRAPSSQAEGAPGEASQAGTSSVPVPGAPISPEPGNSSSNQATATVVVGTPPDWEHPRRTDRSTSPRASESESDAERTLHGFRLGYLVLIDYDDPREPGHPETSVKAEAELRSPHQFVIGYELAQRLRAEGEWLNVLVVGNAMVAGLEQSRFLPTANLLLGFELERALQLGVGINLAPVSVKPAHMVLAAGWTPRSGELYLPVHLFFIPDVDGHHRAGITVGVNWGT